MPSPLPRQTVVALLTHPVAQARVREALRDRAQVLVVQRVHEAIAHLRDPALSLAALVLEPADAEGRSTVPVVHLATSPMRPVPVLGYCSLRPEDRRRVIELTQAGVHDVTFHELEEGALVLRTLLAEAEQTCGADTILAQLRELVPGELLPFLVHALMYPAQAKSVADVARALGLNRRTLVNLCTRARVPAPRELLMWARLLLAAYLLDTREASIEAVALRLHYPSAGALRSATRRYLGCSPADLRDGDGLARGLRAFRERVSVTRRSQIQLMR